MCWQILVPKHIKIGLYQSNSIRVESGTKSAKKMMSLWYTQDDKYVIIFNMFIHYSAA